jgi:hypothetical protein
MAHLVGAFLRPAPGGFGFDRIAKWQNGQEVQLFGDGQQFLDALPLHAANPAGTKPFIPARQLHILDGAGAVDLMPVIGRVGDHSHGTTRLLDETPRRA